ncbi:SIR2 family NAD-dependent protein deacylase [Lachnotalea sp. AF33-28]|uniref:SIR2 family NAD-dependent protein deacylase n=1 Tax=Lachnotalea sp. AF33-28 TaxID=2292046 RepID=UPI000E47BC85|nr:Sir2 silent information regulator family NAD-dependent deacetylase [Lachnotalea sp. AF33-28]RHP36142.1 Sir2 silent information regulator family NAD-dependent deacetylase [Lachnotalea sp. AF33-28]
MNGIESMIEQLAQAQAVVIGAGSGLSAAAGFTYTGERFTRHFSEFIERYHMTDMYSAGFYPFQTQEEKWAYWSRHIYYNRYDQDAGKAYLDLLNLVRDKNYFVITTNVDHQFWLAGFQPERIFATQGDYGKFQCARACHEKLYDNEAQVRAMLALQRNCRIPEELVPRCPVCGGNMEVNLRCDQYFVEDEAWHEAEARYEVFLAENQEKRVLFLELGVGMNTPVIIKYPFWQMTRKLDRAFYICVNRGQAWAPEEISERSLCMDGDIAEILNEVRAQ